MPFNICLCLGSTPFIFIQAPDLFTLTTVESIAQCEWAFEVKVSILLSVECSNRKPVSFFP